jgi:hypothetical protein
MPFDCARTEEQADGGAALEQLAVTIADVAPMDVRMPACSGAVTLRRSSRSAACSSTRH